MTGATGPLILYVEDEPAISELALVALGDAGYEVVAVSSGLDAVAVLDTRAEDLAAVVTDIDLGSDPNGWEVARHARKVAPSISIIYVSGGSSGDWSSEGVPGSVMLVKPYALAQLVVAVSTATVEGSGSGSPTG